MNKLLFILFLSLAALSVILAWDNDAELIATEDSKNRLYELLFPGHNRAQRQLYGEFIPNAEVNCLNAGKANASTIDDDYIPCVKCSSLERCAILNGFVIQEVYLPENKELKGTCAVIESLATNIYNEVFGIGRTFRDTPQCRGSSLLITTLFYLINCCLFLMRQIL